MKYAREVIELMSAYPGRNFRKREIVKYVYPCTQNTKERNAINRGVLYVLDWLIMAGSVLKTPPRSGNGSYALYRWQTAK